MADIEVRSADPASQQMIVLASEAGITTVWDRLSAQKTQCRFGKLGLCCRNCFMGPCRVSPDGKGAEQGICGAGVDTIVARNLLRHITAGVAAHSDHGHEIIRTLLLASTAPSETYKIRSPERLRALADGYGIAHCGLNDQELGKEMANLLLGEFGKQDGTLINLLRAPEQQQKNWAAANTAPRGIDREIVSGLHMTNMGVDNVAEHLLLASVRTALADGWGGSMIATDMSDVLFGAPHPLRSRVNLGVLKADEVNILVHGHEPTLSDGMVAATRDPQLLAEGAAKGAKGIN